MNSKTDFDQPIIRRREMLALTGLERGLVSGWEERGLWQYRGPEGKHRFYSPKVVLSMVLAAELCRAGINPRYAWDAVKAEINHVVAGRIKYIVATQRKNTFGWRGLKSVDDLKSILEPPARGETARVVIILAADDIRAELCEEIDRFIGENLSDAEIERRTALTGLEGKS
jgi:hypothetical protein